MTNRSIAAITTISVTLLVLPSVGAAAVLDGQTVQATWYVPDLASVYSSVSVVVGSGVDIPGYSNGFDINLSDTNIFFSNPAGLMYSNDDFNGWRFYDSLGTIPVFTSVAINPATNMVGFDASRITFDANNIYVNFQSLPMNPATVVSLDITAIPEPTTFALSVLGLLGIARRRK